MPSGSGDRWPEDYERGRPGWPGGAVDVARLPPTATVLDLGAGTGKLTRLLVSAFDRVIAVEPAEAMRGVLLELCPEAEARAGTGQEIPLPDRSVDAIFAAQSFHWFDEEPAIAEIARVLRPGGSLVLMWNLPAGPWEPSTAGAEAVLRQRLPEGELGYVPLDLGGPTAESGWQPAVANSPFEPFEATVLPNPQTLDREGLVAFYASMGWLAELPDAERLPLLDEVRSLLTAAEYVRLWETHVHWAGLRDAPEDRDVALRALTRTEIDLIWTIDRSEVHHHIYKVVDGQLTLVSAYFEIPGWHPRTIESDTPLLHECFDRGGVFIGAFEGDALVGVAVVDTNPVGSARKALQLRYLYVSRPHRGRGVGSRLFAAAAEAARELGAQALYISSVPTENTVNFYLSRGASLATDPDPDLVAAEPEDIHLTYPL